MPIIRTIRAYENEQVEIAWTCTDGSIYTQRFSIPPKPVRLRRGYLDAVGGPGGKVTVETSTPTAPSTTTPTSTNPTPTPGQE